MVLKRVFGVLRTNAGDTAQHPGDESRRTPKTQQRVSGRVSVWKAWLPLLVLIVLWTIELYVVQQYTAIRTYHPRFMILKLGVRFCLTLSLIATLCLALPRLWLIAVMLVGAVFELVVISFSQCFNASLSYFHVTGQWKEGFQVLDGGLIFLPWLAIVGVAAALLSKVLLVWRACPASFLQRRTRIVLALLCLSCYIGGVGACQWRLGLLRRSIVEYETGDVVFVVGYLPAWGGEWYYSRDDEVFLDWAMESAAESTDNMTPTLPLLPESDLFVAVQFESLGYSLLNKKVGGKDLVPFLLRLAESSAVFRLRVMHMVGSADSDFAFLTGIRPNGLLLPYKVPGFPWKTSSWVRTLLDEKGYQTVWFNGFSKVFFARETPYEKMGFRVRFCQEELKGRYPDRSFGLFSDADMYRQSLEWLEEHPDEPAFHFFISATSHIPWTLEDPQQRIIFPDPGSNRENYFNSVAYADRCMSDYYERLPNGTVFVVYGDQRLFTGAEDAGTERGEEYTACLINVKGENFGAQQKDVEGARKGRYTIVDLGAYVKNSIRQWSPRTNPPTEANLPEAVPAN